MPDSARHSIDTATEADLGLIEPLNTVLGILQPILQSEGGDARLRSIREGVARIAFGGGCEGCGGALAGMEGGLRLMLMERVPGLKEVVFE
jgi:Fe-S cluster biogenesis protein NfuA